MLRDLFKDAFAQTLSLATANFTVQTIKSERLASFNTKVFLKIF
jgi:hypothetical protein